jgi:general secretion pathway protein B
MSLILEALRKSEAERRRGQAPGLHAELPPPYATRPAALPAWAWWLLACTLLLAAAWLLRGLLPLAAPAAPAAPAPDAAATTAATTTPTDRVATQPRFRPPPPAAIPTKAPASEAPPQPETTATNTLPPSTTTSQAVATAPVPAISVPDRPAPSAPPPTAATGALLQLSDLSPEERKSLPPLKLSMHLWNPDPAKRFVIVDGNRVGEGGRVGDAVVAAITSDGLELDWNGRRLQVPIH